MSLPRVVVAGFGDFAGNDVKCWSSTVTTNAQGQWTVDYSDAGFTVPPLVLVQASGTTVAANGAAAATVVSKSTTGASGTVTRPNTATLNVAGVQVLGAALMMGPSASVDVVAFGK